MRVFQKYDTLNKSIITIKDMGCEDGGCWHHRLESDIFRVDPISTVRPEPRPPLLGKNVCNMVLDDTILLSPLSREAIDAESTRNSQPEGIELPVFENYSDFIKSDFFVHHYDLWTTNITTQALYDFIEPQAPDEMSMKVQRILLILWYLQLSDFNPEMMYTEGRLDTEISYYGALFNFDKQAIQRLQRNYSITVDWVIGKEVKSVMYYLVYNFFHSQQRDSCVAEHKEMIENLKRDFE